MRVFGATILELWILDVVGSVLCHLHSRDTTRIIFCPVEKATVNNC